MNDKECSRWESTFRFVRKHPVTIDFDSTMKESRPAVRTLTAKENAEQLRRCRTMTVVPTKGHVCGKRCHFQNFEALLSVDKKTLAGMGYDTNLFVGNCHKIHSCVGRCDEMELMSDGMMRCRITGRASQCYVSAGYIRNVDVVGQAFRVMARGAYHDACRTSMDVKYNKNSHENPGKELIFRERKLVFPKEAPKWDVHGVLGFVLKVMNMQSINMGKNKRPVVVFSRSLVKSLRETTVEAMAISSAVLRVSESRGAKLLESDDRSLIRTVESNLLKLLPGMYRLKMELSGILNAQCRLHAQVYKYLLWSKHRAHVSVVPNFMKIYEMLHFDWEWTGNLLVPFPTWKEWLQIIETTVRICMVCRTYKGLEGEPKVERMNTDDVVIAAINFQSDGWSHQGESIIEQNWYLSESGHHLKLHKFSKYKISQKGHRVGVTALKSSLEHMLRSVGRKLLYEFFYPWKNGERLEDPRNSEVSAQGHREFRGSAGLRGERMLKV